MHRRRLLALLSGSTASALAGCAAHVRGPPEETTTDAFHRNPTTRELPERPDRFTNDSAAAFAGEYESVRFHNEQVEDGATRIDYSCSGRVGAATDRARYVVVDCSGAVYDGTAVSDYFPGLAAVYRVTPDGFTTIDDWERATDAADASVETATAGPTTASSTTDARDGATGLLAVGNFADDASTVALDVERARTPDGRELEGITYSLPADAGVTQPLRVPDGVEASVRMATRSGASLAFDWTPAGAVRVPSAAAFVTPAGALAGGVIEDSATESAERPVADAAD